MTEIKESFQLPRGMGLKELANTLVDLLSRIRVKEVTVTQNGRIDMVRVTQAGDPPDLPEIKHLNPLFSAYDHWADRTKVVALVEQESLLAAAIAALQQCDTRKLIPLGFLVSPDHANPHYQQEIRPTYLGIPLLVEPRCSPLSLVLLAGIDLEGGPVTSTISFFVPIQRVDTGSPS